MQTGAKPHRFDLLAEPKLRFSPSLGTHRRGGTLRHWEKGRQEPLPQHGVSRLSDRKNHLIRHLHQTVRKETDSHVPIKKRSMDLACLAGARSLDEPQTPK